MGFSIDVSIPVLTVFLQGVISFFSPCVLPLIPLYIGYLSGGTGVRGEDGRIYYKRSKVMLHTLCFVLGVSFAFFLLGLGFSALGSFFKSNQLLFARIGGILVVLFGLYQLGVFGSSSVLGKERRLPFSLGTLAMSPLTALIMGFTFSFAWTPCVGPALASVLLMAASAATKTMGFVLIGVYTLGFVLPFLAVGFFTTSVLEFFKAHGNIAKNAVKAGGILMVFMGILMFTGKMNAVTGYLSSIPSPAVTESKAVPETEAATEALEEESVPVQEKQEESDAENQPLPAVDFTLTDQFGNSHSLSDYKGKTIFLNFWATWCPPCRAEMPDIQKIYDTANIDGDDALIILGVAAPDYGREKDEKGIKQFLEENGYTYPVLMDQDAELFTAYGIYSYPTTFMIDRDGNVFGYASGQLSEDTMRSIIEQTMKGQRK
ncbi:cytochrome c biogenesis protein CcdA [Lacrimispora saccharolytica]|uniref:Cytochrome c biogenesis protein transmembrane region n=1 Tax=Lacrimispora saccharolytica (strain ATCC 35040 / DSM 2544 / NRCC 2533 / WM1) TaxID=610130 RepID=D9R9A8_LACSW|nr:cytochrome c biogenesis protein CcdA [Lacrimispora saccharolytica]ADL05859.1 cytochrome c biogenesis protein transmembrane region [[Clostridium] saccharolyticum WM1]QRV20015.1 redoxin family protein [Lacrimispora saccharolytica]